MRNRDYIFSNNWYSYKKNLVGIIFWLISDRGIWNYSQRPSSNDLVTLEASSSYEIQNEVLEAKCSRSHQKNTCLGFNYIEGHMLVFHFYKTVRKSQENITWNSASLYRSASLRFIMVRAEPETYKPDLIVLFKVSACLAYCFQVSNLHVFGCAYVN